MNNKRIPQAPQEVTDLRSKIKKYHKNGKLGLNLVTVLADETGMSKSLISQFKDGIRGLSIEGFFKLKDTVESLEKFNGITKE